MVVMINYLGGLILYINESIDELTAYLNQLMYNLVYQYGYLGIFIVSLISNGTFILPVPYLFVIYTVGSYNLFNPIVLSIIAGVGAAIGETTLYLITVAGRRILPRNVKDRLEIYKRMIDKYGPSIIFIFAVTPLPDDILYPILGIMRYSLVKIIIACFLGKTILIYLTYMLGYYSSEFIEIFVGGESFIVNIITVLLGFIFAVILVKIDWTKYIPLDV